MAFKEIQNIARFFMNGKDGDEIIVKIVEVTRGKRDTDGRTVIDIRKYMNTDDYKGPTKQGIMVDRDQAVKLRDMIDLALTQPAMSGDEAPGRSKKVTGVKARGTTKKIVKRRLVKK